jgi:hypothetical protein
VAIIPFPGKSILRPEMALSRELDKGIFMGRCFQVNASSSTPVPAIRATEGTVFFTVKTDAAPSPVSPLDMDLRLVDKHSFPRTKIMNIGKVYRKRVELYIRAFIRALLSAD